MPTYRALRAKHSLKELFFTPELAAEITLMPIEQFGMDAAILFSDITVVALPLGFSLDFNEGPVIKGELKPCGVETLEPIAKAIALIKPQLKVPLIGFCGGPYTVASYINGDPNLLNPITDVTIEYIRMQERAGVDAIQIFDSWADRPSAEEFQKFCFPFLKRIIDATTVPVIVFMRGAYQRLDELLKLNPNGVSFDSAASLPEIRQKAPKLALQGNLDPNLLYQPLPVIEKTTKELLLSMKEDPGFIVNLGHGMKPDMSVDSVRTLVDAVKSF